MDRDDQMNGDAVELRPLVGLLHGLPACILERLAIRAIKDHRELGDRAESLFHALPDEVRTGREVGSNAHVDYLEATIAMHAQMSALTTVLRLLGYIPKI